MVVLYENLIQSIQYIFQETYTKPLTSNCGSSSLVFDFRAFLQFQEILTISNIRHSFKVEWV